MEIKDVITKIESSEEFKTIDPDHYLVHVFRMMDAHSSDECQVGYYSKKSDRVIVFDYLDGNIKMTDPQEAFKEKNFIAALEIDKINVTMDQALDMAEDVIKKNYPAHLLSKAILLLQKLPEYGQIWNVTVITHTFNVINVKIDAVNSKLIKHSMESLLGWKKDE